MYVNEAVRIDCATALAQLDMLQGHTERAWKHITDCMPSGPAMQPGTTYFLEFLELQDLAVTLALDSGDADRAAAWITAFGEWIAWSEMVLRRPRPELAWSRYHYILGEFQVAREHALRALELANDPYQPLYCLAAHRALARIAIPAGRLEEATHHLDAALAIALACEAPFEIAVTHVVQAEWLIAAGRPADAIPLLQQSRDTAERLGARPLVEQIDNQIASLAREPARPASRQTGLAARLSPREIDVLLLVARGYTDAEVAEQLYISPRTVSGHLQSIYNKLGISSRTAATAFAYEQGLV
jgi:DNA-binding NarL/FixJ family response regulator